MSILVQMVSRIQRTMTQRGHADMHTHGKAIIDLPEPDLTIDDNPVWEREQKDEWGTADTAAFWEFGADGVDVYVDGEYAEVRIYDGDYSGEPVSPTAARELARRLLAAADTADMLKEIKRTDDEPPLELSPDFEPLPSRNIMYAAHGFKIMISESPFTPSDEPYTAKMGFIELPEKHKWAGMERKEIPAHVHGGIKYKHGNILGVCFFVNGDYLPPTKDGVIPAQDGKKWTFHTIKMEMLEFARQAKEAMGE